MSNVSSDLARDLFTPKHAETMRAFCAEAGDWAQKAASEVERILGEARNRRPQAFEQGLEELTKRGAITAKDAGVLKRLMGAVFNELRDRGGPDERQSQIATCVRELQDDHGSSPAALAIAMVASRAATHAPSPTTASGTHVMHAVSGATIGFGVGGAVIGAGIGSAFGPIGAGLGAVIGGAVGAGIEISNEKGV